MTLLHYQPPTIPFLNVVYEDGQLLVVDKSSGLLSVPGKRPEHKDSVYTRVQRAHPHIRVVHRLDMATSGILLLAKTKAAQSHLNRQFQNRTTNKKYVAKVWGTLPAPQGEIELPLSCDWPNRPRQHMDFFTGKASTTFYRVSDVDGNCSRVELTPYTGRSHQLRVHMQAVGCPILGDKFYAHDDAFAAADRLLLHAEYLAVTHPTTEQPIEFHSPVPF
ncbi:pseudouridine synthase [Idiomarina sp. HP20-50]|uniref:pseudouridine synthase n=1 Tax=Idiomarina sp. HP20-50 TaxID=3070813 RepID=UPI00294B4079|nr:pseudouridine synthase [Idiomarina sp. HP20-50]MDV6315588.1 pseudouridine synthase [Idiomarina sp. HP20-50]